MQIQSGRGYIDKIHTYIHTHTHIWWSGTINYEIVEHTVDRQGPGSNYSIVEFFSLFLLVTRTKLPRPRPPTITPWLDIRHFSSGPVSSCKISSRCDKYGGRGARISHFGGKFTPFPPPRFDFLENLRWHNFALGPVSSCKISSLCDKRSGHGTALSHTYHVLSLSSGPSGRKTSTLRVSPPAPCSDLAALGPRNLRAVRRWEVA